MLLKWVLLASTLCAAYAVNHVCISFDRCMEDPERGYLIFTQNKHRLQNYWANYVDHVGKQLEQARRELNSEIKKSDTSQCKGFFLRENGHQLAKWAINWCLSRAELCREHISVRAKRDVSEEDCDDDAPKKCAALALKNEQCENIDYKIHVLDHCNYLSLFERVYKNPYESCEKEFCDETAKLELNSGECDWYQQAVDLHADHDEEFDFDEDDELDIWYIRGPKKIRYHDGNRDWNDWDPYASRENSHSRERSYENSDRSSEPDTEEDPRPFPHPKPDDWDTPRHIDSGSWEASYENKDPYFDRYTPPPTKI